MRKFQCVYALDWLQLYCRTKYQKHLDLGTYESPQADMYGEHRTYELRGATEFIHGYHEQADVWWKEYKVATIAWHPTGARKHLDAAAIKMANHTLYTTQWHFILHDILKTLQWTAVNITRADFACDLNYFVRGLYPETFIRKYMRRTSDTYIRKGSNKWCSVGVKDMHTNTYDYIRWGSRQSGVSVYLYNKSKELKEQKYKPWIAELWKRGGLDVSKVWRVEISVNSSGRGLKSAFSQLVHSLFVDDISTQQSLQAIFQTYARDYFCFLWKPKNGAKYKKDLKPVELLPLEDALPNRPCTLYRSASSSRMEKYVYRNLEQLHSEIERSDDRYLSWLKYPLENVMEYYERKSNLAHKCDTLREELCARTEMAAMRYVDESEWRARYRSLRNIKDDREYLQEIAHQVARRVSQFYMQGYMDEIPTFAT